MQRIFLPAGTKYKQTTDELGTTLWVPIDQLSQLSNSNPEIVIEHIDSSDVESFIRRCGSFGHVVDAKFYDGGCLYISFVNRKIALKAIMTLNGQIYNGQKLTVHS
jgi:hypothetical protein